MIRIALVIGVLAVVSAASAGAADLTVSSAPVSVAVSQSSSPSASEAAVWPVPVDPKTYAPQFSSVKTEHGNTWILDHGRKIALVEEAKVGLFRHRPGEAVNESQIVEDEKLNEWFMVPGLRLWTEAMPGKYNNKHLKDVPRELMLDTSDSARLTIRMSWKKSASEFQTQVTRVTYDRDLARYVLHVEADLQSDAPGGGEYCNFYAQGMGDFRPGRSRYDRVLYQDASDGDKRKVHFPSVLVSKPEGDLLSPAQVLVDCPEIELDVMAAERGSRMFDQKGAEFIGMDHNM
jgi:hypothetical protein